MIEFLRHEKDILQELLLNTESDEAGSCDSDKDVHQHGYLH